MTTGNNKAAPPDGSTESDDRPSGLRAGLYANTEQLLRYAKALTRNRDAAEELVQDCLLRALVFGDRWKPGTNLRAWLFTLLHNLYISSVRARARRPGEISIEEVVEELMLPPAQGDRSEFNDLLWAFERIDPKQREVILLIAVEGFSYKETAAVLNVPIGTVMSRLSRGREALRQLMTTGQNGREGLRIVGRPND